jgi:4'-phosphopantetheinyl transferase
MLCDGDVHIWHIDIGEAKWDFHTDVLSLEEQKKAGRFRIQRGKQSYQRCRIALRAVLGEYCRKSPGDITFEYNQFGKPLIDGGLHFNVSHSGDVALIAVSLAIVGIDVEMVDSRSASSAGILSAICHPTEIAALSPLPENIRRRLLFRLWTQKEAYLKAIGIGLRRSPCHLRLVAVSTPASWRVCDEDEASPSSPFFIHEIPDVGNSGIASVCSPFGEARLSRFFRNPGSG